ncbi:MAG TPA: glycosyltransferase family 9 protein [Chloroflexi bacterium]|nr:glycosyltransferase family 9 protein [Chloroflexota bacterium]
MRPESDADSGGDMRIEGKSYAPHNLPRAILVVKLSDIGDVLTATPALRALRVSFPEAKIDALVPPGSAPVLANSPLADEVIVFNKFAYDHPGEALKPANLLAALRLGRELRHRHYDAIVLLHHLTTWWGVVKYAALALTLGAPIRAGLDNGRGFFLTHSVPDKGFGYRHEVEYCLDVVRILGAESEGQEMEFYPSDEDERWAEKALRGLKRPIVAIHPGSGGYSPARRWDLERFAELGDRLAFEGGASIVLIGTKADGVSKVARLMHHPHINLEGRTSLGQLGALLKRCDLFVGADSGVMHLAAAMRTPLIALFGPTNPDAWGPWTPYSPSQVIRIPLPCSPCSYVGFTLNRRGCPARECMKGISVERVLKASLALLSRGAGKEHQRPRR